jgi:hypothetical protein
MQEQSKKQSRRGKLLGGALVGAVLSIGVVAGPASAATPVSRVAAYSDAPSEPVYEMAARSGIRW